jgi:hypothetical protein
LEEIARRKQALVERCADQRAELSGIYQKISSPFDVSGTLVGIGRTLKAHPLIAAGISSFLVSGYARRMVKSAGEVLRLWRLILPVWAWWRSRRKAS